VGKEPGQSVFTKRKTELCPSCLDRDAINLLGQPRYSRGAALTNGCEECGGTGINLATGEKVKMGGRGFLYLPDHKRQDPYMNKIGLRVSSV